MRIVALILFLLEGIFVVANFVPALKRNKFINQSNVVFSVITLIFLLLFFGGLLLLTTLFFLPRGMSL